MATRKKKGGDLKSLRAAAAAAKREASKVCTVAFREGRARQRALDADGLRAEIATCEDITRSARGLTDEYATKRPRPTPLQLQARERATVKRKERLEFAGRDAVAIVRARLSDVDDATAWRAVKRAMRKLPSSQRRHDRVAELALEELRQGKLDAAYRGRAASKGLDRYARDNELREAIERIAELEARLERLRGASQRVAKRAGARLAAAQPKRKATKKPAKKAARRRLVTPTTVIVVDDRDDFID